MTTRKIIARFQPQVWVNDCAMNVDPLGPDTWDVTEEVLDLGKDAALALADDDYSTDELRYSKNAPQWVQEWSGPFYTVVELSITEYFASVQNEANGEG